MQGKINTLVTMKTGSVSPSEFVRLASLFIRGRLVTSENIRRKNLLHLERTGR